MTKHLRTVTQSLFETPNFIFKMMSKVLESLEYIVLIWKDVDQEFKRAISTKGTSYSRGKNSKLQRGDFQPKEHREDFQGPLSKVPVGIKTAKPRSK
jgi:hypothetical protein